MQPTPSTEIAREFAEALVEKTKQLRGISDEIHLLKLELYDAAKGGISVPGGRVQFVDEGTALRFDRNALKEKLVAKFSLTEAQADQFLDECKSESSRLPYIAVFLE
jgi:hypothetical protein